MVDVPEKRASGLDSWHDLLFRVAREGVHNAARGFSGMVGEHMQVSELEIRQVPLQEIATLLGEPENEAVGIYLRSEGQMPGHIMIVIPQEKACELVDLMNSDSPGTTQQLGSLERSALAELGNLTGTFFLNAVARQTGLDLRPSPPAVMVDMIGAILDVIFTEPRGLVDHLLMIQATFLQGDRQARVDFWILPDRDTLEAFFVK
jgi:chemotaxis protein CheC